MVINDKKFIIPLRKASIIAELENNIIKETGRIDVPYTSKSIFSYNRLFVSICFGSKNKSKRLKIFNEYGNQLLRKNEYKFESINFKDNTVYLGGQYNKNKRELFTYIDLSDVNFEMNEVILPIKSIEGKSIDDILIRNNILYLVDNIVYPKFIFKYDINIPNNPKYIGNHKLEENGTYEHIIKGDISENWIILFSFTVGMGGVYQHISIIGQDENFKKNIVLTFCVEDKIFSENIGNKYNRVLDTCLINNKLMVLKENGLFSLDLENEKNMLQINSNEEKYLKFLKINEDNYIIQNEEKFELIEL